LLVTSGIARRRQRLEQNAERVALGRPLIPAPPGRDEISQVDTRLRRTADQIQDREERLHERESILRSFYDSAPLLMGVVELIGDDVLHLSDNAATAAFYGVAPEVMPGRLASELGLAAEAAEAWVRHCRESEAR